MNAFEDYGVSVWKTVNDSLKRISIMYVFGRLKGIIRRIKG
jgi:hypothetical protein